MDPKPEALSFLGKRLYAEDLRQSAQVTLLDCSVVGAANALEEGDSPSARLAHASALRAAGRYRAALATLSSGLRRWPDEPRLLSDRGHTYVNVRAVGLALADLQAAVELDDRSFDAWYHLALARYFDRDFSAAAEAFAMAAEVTDSASSRLAARVWQYTALRRGGAEGPAEVLLPTIEWDVDLEGRNENYQLRARLYQGSLGEADLMAAQRPATKSEGSLGFGLGVWYLFRGLEAEARAHFEAAAGSPFWPAFGTAAAELELASMDGVPSAEPEAVGLLGEPLYAELSVAPEARPAAEAAAAAAARSSASAPDDVALTREHARTLASGLGRYRDAVAVLERALAARPRDPELLCDRGHYRVNVRRFKEAIADLEEAVRLKPHLHGGWYHLGLARWMLGEIPAAVDAFRHALATCDAESQVVAYSDWLFLGLRRLGRDDEATKVLKPIHAGMATTGNNHLYLRRLLFYQGAITEDELVASLPLVGLAHASLYGVGCWHLSAGRRDRARQYFLDVVDRGTAWGAFAYVAAEAELYREFL